MPLRSRPLSHGACSQGRPWVYGLTGRIRGWDCYKTGADSKPKESLRSEGSGPSEFPVRTDQQLFAKGWSLENVSRHRVRGRGPVAIYNWDSAPTRGFPGRPSRRPGICDIRARRWFKGPFSVIFYLCDAKLQVMVVA